MDADTLAIFGSYLILLGAWSNVLFLGYTLHKRRRGYRRWWVRPHLREHERHRHGDYHNLFQRLKTTDHEEFFAQTRMTVPMFETLLALVSPLLQKRSIRRPLPTELRLYATLSYLAHGDSILTKASQMRIGKSTMYKIVPETCAAIWKALSPIYMKPPTREDWVQISEAFRLRWNMPNCLGALDGKHIKIQAPANSGTMFHNYKGFFSVVLMAAADATYRFIWVDVGDYGSQNDSGIFTNSEFGQALERNSLDIPPPCNIPGTDICSPFFFVGDEAFPLKPNLLRPYSRRNLTGDTQRIFNYRLSRARRVVENSFGILVSRWNILKGTICCKPRTAEMIVLALTCLHNFIMTEESAMNANERRYMFPTLVDHEDARGNIIEGEWRHSQSVGILRRVGRMGANFGAAVANSVRDELAEYFITDDGQVPWQWNILHRGFV